MMLNTSDCCRLMFQGLAQFGIALLQFFEESDVFDGDDGLSGESFKKDDLPCQRKDGLRNRRITITPIATPSRSKGVTKHRSTTATLR